MNESSVTVLFTDKTTIPIVTNKAKIKTNIPINNNILLILMIKYNDWVSDDIYI